MNEGFLQTQKINELADFYQKPFSGVCFVEGKTGFFKTPLINKSLELLGEDFLTFKIKCFESTTLDDIFLDLFEDLKKYALEKKVTFAKIETNSISQRINKYLNHITNPAVIVVDSLQNVFNNTNEEDKEEILRFISHLNSMNKFKIVLVSTFFPVNITQILEINNFTRQLKLTMESFTKEQTAEYFESEGIQNPPETLDKFFELSKGNPTYIYITANIINTLNTSLQSLLNEFAAKKLNFEDYLLQKLTTFVPETVKKSLYILSLFNGGLTEKFLIKEEFFTKEQIAYMIEKGLLASEYGVIYLKGYLKKYLQKSIDNYEKIRIHTMWRDFYTSQLPAKPSDRVTLISRNTMRAQIQHHGSFIVKQRTDTDAKDLSFMSYLNSNLTAWNLKNTNIDTAEDEDASKTGKNRPQPPKSIENKFKTKESLEKYELTKDEVALLSVPIDMRKKEEHEAKERLYRTFEQQEEKKKQAQKGVQELFSLAVDLESSHNFETAASLYLRALELKTDSSYYDFLPAILEKLAILCRKLNKTTEAIDFYNQLSDLYSQRNETEKMNEIKLEIAQIYKDTYKISHARLIYENFINKKTESSDKILLRSYIELAEIEEDLSNTEKAIEYYKKGFSLFNLNENYNNDEAILETVSQAYFKYALILDDFHKTQSALDFYQRCIKTAKKPTVYLSSSYTNIGEILKESGNLSKAVEYYKQALKTDLEQSNYEGIYYISLKIAKAYEKLNPQQALNWLLKSLSAAKRTKEELYISNAYKEVGDYYSKRNESDKAQKAYSMANKNEKTAEQ